MKKLSLWPWKNISLGFLVVVVLGLLFGGTGAEFLESGDGYMMRQSKNFASGGAVSEMAMMAYDSDESARGMIAPPMPGSPDGVAPGVSERELIRSGNLSLIVEDVEYSVEKIKIQVSEWKGIVEEANINRLEDDRRSGWMRLRVPNAGFDDAMKALKAGALKVESETARVDDVTGQVVDSKARLNNMRAEEAQYKDILARAVTVEDTLQATQYLNRVRNDIEWAERNLKNITERVALSSINVNLIDEGDVEVLGVYWTPWLNVKKAARGALENITFSVDVLVKFLLNLPVLLVYGFLLWAFLKLAIKGLKKSGLL
ncbi:MAG: DUF4349 domain-containing protein [Candidatus Gracilibacteria bacterium]|nr:DUF4349 domain-containing protein [Candidatus Gracilibacteria bacterium]